MKRKPNLRRLYIWGCSEKARVYNTREKKLESQTLRGYLVGYKEKYKGCMFYYPINSLGIVEIDNAIFIENGKVNGSVERQRVEINDVRVNSTFYMHVLLPHK